MHEGACIVYFLVSIAYQFFDTRDSQRSYVSANFVSQFAHMKSKNDVTFDEEFYRDLCKTYGTELRHKIFFFIDNRNYIGKDVPYQLIYQRNFKLPLFVKSVVVAHDVEDFSKIWQAMVSVGQFNELQIL